MPPISAEGPPISALCALPPKRPRVASELPRCRPFLRCLLPRCRPFLRCLPRWPSLRCRATSTTAPLPPERPRVASKPRRERGTLSRPCHAIRRHPPPHQSRPQPPTLPAAMRAPMPPRRSQPRHRFTPSHAEAPSPATPTRCPRGEASHASRNPKPWPKPPRREATPPRSHPAAKPPQPWPSPPAQSPNSNTTRYSPIPAPAGSRTITR